MTTITPRMLAASYTTSRDSPDQQSALDHHTPLFTYTHEDGCSISGGVRARGAAGRFDGHYVFADYCAGTLTALPILGDGSAMSAGEPTVMTGLESPTAVVSGPDGTVYVLAGNGVSRLDG